MKDVIDLAHCLSKEKEIIVFGYPMMPNFTDKKQRAGGGNSSSQKGILKD